MRIGFHQVGQSGATDKQAPLWDNTLGLWVPGTVVQSVVPGTGVAVDNTDPANPKVSASAVTALEPLTTEIGGDPMLIWDDDNKLVLTEVM